MTIQQAVEKTKERIEKILKECEGENWKFDEAIEQLLSLIDEEKEKSELIGVGKILDCLWDNSYYSMGKLGADRIEQEMIYYFGKDWNMNMYKIIGSNGMRAQSVKPLKDFTKEQRKALVTNLEEK